MVCSFSLQGSVFYWGCGRLLPSGSWSNRQKRMSLSVTGLSVVFWGLLAASVFNPVTGLSIMGWMKWSGLVVS